jgi:hypothetical protein
MVGPIRAYHATSASLLYTPRVVPTPNGPWFASTHIFAGHFAVLHRPFCALCRGTQILAEVPRRCNEHWAPGRDLDRRFKESHLSTQTSTDHIYLGLGFVPAFQPHPLSYRHTCTTHSNKLLLSATQQHWATAGCRLHRDTEHQGTHKPSFDRRHPFVNKKTANAQMWSLMNETNGANSSQGIDGTSEPKCCLQMDETYETNETNETK